MAAAKARSQTYLGPAATFGGVAVPAGGLKVTLTDAQVIALIERGHVFAGKDGDILRGSDLGVAEIVPAAPAATT